MSNVVQLTEAYDLDISNNIQRSDEPLDYTDNIQRSDIDISNSIQRSDVDISNSIQRSDIDISNSIQRSDIDISNSIQRSDEPKYDIDISNSIQRSFDRYEIDSDFDEEEYWHFVEQERLKDQLEDFEECGANMSNKEHDFIMNTTLSIIKEFEIEQETELDDESFKKMICNIYPKALTLYTTCIN